MAVVVPKLYVENGQQIPVWEITTEKLPGKPSQQIYYERLHRPGYVPIGAEHYAQPDGGSVTVSESVNMNAINWRSTWKDEKGQRHLRILKSEDGFEAPASWYQRLAPGGESYVEEDEPEEPASNEQEETESDDGTWGYSDDEDDTGFMLV